MTPLNLLYALKKLIEETVKDYRIFDENRRPRIPPVYLGYAPNKQTQEDSEYPCIIIRLYGGTDEEKTGTIRLVIGVFTYQESARDDTQEDIGIIEKTKGWDSALEIVWRIRTKLLEHRLIDEKFNLSLPLEWELPTEQAEPQWASYITANYTIDVPENQDMIKELMGYGNKKSSGLNTRGYEERIDTFLSGE